MDDSRSGAGGKARILDASGNPLPLVVSRKERMGQIRRSWGLRLAALAGIITASALAVTNCASIADAIGALTRKTEVAHVHVGRIDGVAAAESKSDKNDVEPGKSDGVTTAESKSDEQGVERGKLDGVAVSEAKADDSDAMRGGFVSATVTLRNSTKKPVLIRRLGVVVHKVWYRTNMGGSQEIRPLVTWNLHVPAIAGEYWGAPPTTIQIGAEDSGAFSVVFAKLKDGERGGRVPYEWSGGSIDRPDTLRIVDRSKESAAEEFGSVGVDLTLKVELDNGAVLDVLKTKAW